MWVKSKPSIKATWSMHMRVFFANHMKNISIVLWLSIEIKTIKNINKRARRKEGLLSQILKQYKRPLLRSRSAHSRWGKARTRTSMNKLRPYYRRVSNWLSIERETESWGITQAQLMKSLSKAWGHQMFLKVVEILLSRRLWTLNRHFIIQAKPACSKRTN